MMGAPVGRDKDAVFKHKRVAETKGSPVSLSKVSSPEANGGGRQPNLRRASLTDIATTSLPIACHVWPSALLTPYCHPYL
jgi:hypothetical protein